MGISNPEPALAEFGTFEAGIREKYAVVIKTTASEVITLMNLLLREGLVKGELEAKGNIHDLSGGLFSGTILIELLDGVTFYIRNPFGSYDHIWICVGEGTRDADYFHNIVKTSNIKRIRSEMIVNFYNSEDRPNVSWNSLYLGSSSIQGIVEGFLKSKERYKGHNIPWKRGMLLHGPPGNGKTMITQAAASMGEFEVVHLVDGGMRLGPEDISRLFKEHQGIEPRLIIIEELSKHINSQNVAAFLQQLDGVTKNSGIFVIATDNHPELLDDAILKRPGRFHDVILIDNPDEAIRWRFISDLIKEYDVKKVQPYDIENLVREAEGMSMSAIEDIFVSSMLLIFNRGLDNISIDDLFEVFAEIKDSFTFEE